MKMYRHGFILLDRRSYDEVRMVAIDVPAQDTAHLGESFWMIDKIDEVSADAQKVGMKKWVLWVYFFSPVRVFAGEQMFVVGPIDKMFDALHFALTEYFG